MPEISSESHRKSSETQRVQRGVDAGCQVLQCAFNLIKPLSVSTRISICLLEGQDRFPIKFMSGLWVLRARKDGCIV